MNLIPGAVAGDRVRLIAKPRYGVIAAIEGPGALLVRWKRGGKLEPIAPHLLRYSYGPRGNCG